MKSCSSTKGCQSGNHKVVILISGIDLKKWFCPVKYGKYLFFCCKVLRVVLSFKCNNVLLYAKNL